MRGRLTFSWPMIVVLVGWSAVALAASENQRPVISVLANALRVQSGWQAAGTDLVSRGPAQAKAQLVLPQGPQSVWVRFGGDLTLRTGSQRIELKGNAASEWQRAGSVEGGQLSLEATASGPGTVVHEFLFCRDASFSPTSSSKGEPRSDGMTLWLGFEETEPFSCHEQVTGSGARSDRRIERVQGPWGWALSCQGRSSVQVADMPSPADTGHLTVEAWIRPTRTEGYRTILFKGTRSEALQAVQFCMDLSDGKLELKFHDSRGGWQGVFDGGQHPERMVAAGRWSHVAATFDRGLVCLYVNGRQVASRRTSCEQLLAGQAPVLIGVGCNVAGARDYQFQGLLDDVRVYARTFTSEAIAAHWRERHRVYPAEATPAESTKKTAASTDPFQQKLRIVEQYERRLPADTIASAKTTASVAMHGGVPALQVNGQPVFPMAMVPIGHFPTKPCRDFAAAGIHLYSHILWTWAVITPHDPTKATESSEWWLGDGQYAFERVDRQIQAIVDADPQAQIFLRVKINVPNWWLKGHPDELARHEDGTPAEQASLASELWEETYQRMLRDLIRHIEGSAYAGHIIGYQPAGGESSEWYWWGYNKGLIDYGPAAVKRFRKWLRERYGNDQDRLRAAWNDSQVGFGNSLPPGQAAREASEYGLFRDARKAQAVIDYRRFLSDITAHNIIRSCRICKEETQGRKITGIFYGYSLHYAASRSLANLGFLGLKQVLESPFVDFLCSPTDYQHRRGGEPGNFVADYTASYRLHGKLYWDEADVRTHLFRGQASYAVRSLPETLAVLQRGFGYMLTKGTALWWFTLAGDDTFHDIAIMEDIARMHQAGLASMPLSKQPPHDVAVLVDEESFFHLRMAAGDVTRPLLREMHDALATMGAPFDMYLLSDLADRRMPDYKLYLFLNSFQLDERLREAVKRKVRRNGAVAAWFYAPGFVRPDGSFSDDAMQDLTGLRIRHTLGPERLRLAVTDYAHPITGEVQRSDTLPVTALLSPAFWADDPEAQVLGRLGADGRAGLVVRDFGTWRSVYSAVPGLPNGMLRGLVRYAGGHVYSNTDDPLFANDNYLMIHTATAGPKRLALPGRRDVLDVMTGQSVGKNLSVIEADLPAEVTRIYRLTDPGN
ncbi:MAG: LamG-like jellyroll fold domain-containing protein [Thermoguttaceae bacterium]